ncbi:citrate lyase holo-[acyl-carrier protein] synthase [Hathewaya histolytica]|uniref:citrate lyase holo-[acyl-carrier protein] synthase n=1 Tax=Hathewaya histolytica TaxID=1498 RepID=A0A4U9QWL5_HATHI|nr:citrate lyase holo-[acyl-carrier protein] synthase [Hathewaya histolytica]VTQ83065.1 citX protein [Hathewaya histolytica]
MWRRLSLVIPHIRIMYSAEDVLNAREYRVSFQEDLIEEYKETLVVMRVNYPGIEKDNRLTRDIIGIMKEEVYKIFQADILFSKEDFTAEGPLVFWVIKGDSLKIKKTTVDIEETHILGRTLDIDVYNALGNSLSRSDIGYDKRVCFLCNEYAHLCVRSKKHNIKSIIDFIENRYEKYINMEKVHDDK